MHVTHNDATKSSADSVMPSSSSSPSSSFSVSSSPSLFAISFTRWHCALLESFPTRRPEVSDRFVAKPRFIWAPGQGVRTPYLRHPSFLLAFLPSGFGRGGGAGPRSFPPLLHLLFLFLLLYVSQRCSFGVLHLRVAQERYSFGVLHLPTPRGAVHPSILYVAPLLFRPPLSDLPLVRSHPFALHTLRMVAAGLCSSFCPAYARSSRGLIVHARC